MFDFYLPYFEATTIAVCVEKQIQDSNTLSPLHQNNVLPIQEFSQFTYAAETLTSTTIDREVQLEDQDPFEQISEFKFKSVHKAYVRKVNYERLKP